MVWRPCRAELSVPTNPTDTLTLARRMMMTRCTWLATLHISNRIHSEHGKISPQNFDHFPTNKHIIPIIQMTSIYHYHYKSIDIRFITQPPSPSKPDFLHLRLLHGYKLSARHLGLPKHWRIPTGQDGGAVDGPCSGWGMLRTGRAADGVYIRNSSLRAHIRTNI